MTSQVKVTRDALSVTFAQAEGLEAIARAWCKPNDYAGLNAPELRLRDAPAIEAAFRRLTEKAKQQFELIERLNPLQARAEKSEARVKELEKELAEERAGLTDFWSLDNVRALVDAYNEMTGESHIPGFAQELWRAGQEVFAKGKPWELTKVIVAAEKAGWKIKEPLWEFVEQLGARAEKAEARVAELEAGRSWSRNLTALERISYELENARTNSPHHSEALIVAIGLTNELIDKLRSGSLCEGCGDAGGFHDASCDGEKVMRAPSVVATSPDLQANLQQIKISHAVVDSFMRRRSGVPSQILAHMVNIRGVVVHLLRECPGAEEPVEAAVAPAEAAPASGEVEAHHYVLHSVLALFRSLVDNSGSAVAFDRAVWQHALSLLNQHRKGDASHA